MVDDRSLEGFAVLVLATLVANVRSLVWPDPDDLAQGVGNLYDGAHATLWTALHPGPDGADGDPSAPWPIPLTPEEYYPPTHPDNLPGGAPAEWADSDRARILNVVRNLRGLADDIGLTLRAHGHDYHANYVDWSRGVDGAGDGRPDLPGDPDGIPTALAYAASYLHYGAWILAQYGAPADDTANHG